ncbi:hypothetical protein PV327_005433 [Microctonus hyperodae]|uniref:Serpin domain-containing protein n=1 Tax=Microctonus hyperodae TaxID=165561 RepID=A0AA39G266_MICHY|nr:hypothetical protein PV327_005433 [Microctonus hyperodae]
MLRVLIFLGVILLTTTVSAFPSKLLFELPSDTFTSLKAVAFDNNEDQSQFVSDAINNSEAIYNKSGDYNSTLSIDDDKKLDFTSAQNISAFLLDTKQLDGLTEFDGNENGLEPAIVPYGIPKSINFNETLNGALPNSDESGLNSTLSQDLTNSSVTSETDDVSKLNKGDNEPEPPVTEETSSEIFDSGAMSATPKSDEEKNKQESPVAETVSLGIPDSEASSETAESSNEENELEPPTTQDISQSSVAAKIGSDSAKANNEEDEPKTSAVETVSSEISNSEVTSESTEPNNEGNEPESPPDQDILQSSVAVENGSDSVILDNEGHESEPPGTDAASSEISDSAKANNEEDEPKNSIVETVSSEISNSEATSEIPELNNEENEPSQNSKEPLNSGELDNEENKPNPSPVEDVLLKIPDPDGLSNVAEFDNVENEPKSSVAENVLQELFDLEKKNNSPKSNDGESQSTYSVANDTALPLPDSKEPLDLSKSETDNEQNPSVSEDVSSALPNSQEASNSSNFNSETNEQLFSIAENNSPPLFDSRESSNSTRPDNKKYLPTPSSASDVIQLSVSKNTSNSSKLNSNENKLSPDIIYKTPLLVSPNNTFTADKPTSNENKPQTTVDQFVIKSSSDSDAFSNTTTTTNDENKLTPAASSIQILPDTNESFYPNISQDNANKIQQAFFQYAIDHTKVLINPSCRDNIATSPMARLLLLSALAYHASPPEKLFYSRKLHLDESDFDLSIGIKGGAANAINKYLIKESKLLPFTKPMWISTNKKTLSKKKEINKWQHLLKQMGIRNYRHSGTKLPFYFGNYEYHFSDNWSQFSHQCLHVSELKFQLGSKTKTSSTFTTMIGKYRTGKINRLNAKFIVIPYKKIMNDEMMLVFLRPNHKLTKIREIIKSKAFSSLSYKDFTNGSIRDAKVALPSIIIDGCNDWQVPPDLPKAKDMSLVDIYHKTLIVIENSIDDGTICNQTEMDEFAGNVFMVNRPSIMFIIWKRMIHISAIIDTPREFEENLEPE